MPQMQMPGVLMPFEKQPSPWQFTRYADDHKEKADPVNHPPHYNSHPSGIEVIEITEHMNFCLGNAIKYILRCDTKGRPIEDLQKAVWYLQREIRRREATQ